MSNTLRDTIFLINSIRRRIQFINNDSMYMNINLGEDLRDDFETIRRTIQVIRNNIQTEPEEINISIQFSNNITNLLGNFIDNIGTHLMNNTDLDYDELVNLPGQKVTLTEQEFYEKIDDVQEEIECGICQEKGNKDVVCLKQWKHNFCKLCLKEWLTKYNVNCPICRKDTR